MNQSAATVLKDIVGRHGVTLLEDHRRCEACLRDTQLPRRDIIGLTAALKSGLPARILQHRASGLTAVAISNYAQRLAEDTGLDLDLARGALQAWAQGLDVKVSGPVGVSERHEEPNPDPPPAPAPARSPARSGWLAYLLVVQAAVLLVVQGYPDPFVTIATYVAGSLSILVAAMLLRGVQWVRWPAAALSVVVLLTAVGEWQTLATILERSGEQQLALVESQPPIIATGIFGIAGFVGALLWRPGARRRTGRLGRTHWIAVAVMLAALWCFLKLGVELGGAVSAVRTGFIFHEKFIWLWAECAVSLVLAWLAWSVLTGRRADLPHVLAAGLLVAGAILGAVYMVVALGFGGHDYWPWDPNLANIVGLVASLGVAGIVLHDWTHVRRTTPTAEKPIA
ncbi:hypothetical protein [Chelatococcus asaccharovorans]|uniref:Uncharacterized protein n=1 Tax=Chelatococcus asaccharovorans TaxID=28210 RepID=A0A2V3TYT5_9HYPH|nr:hypothetical protein [Chelatococcus asaccharovorans]MBS7704645.1 hypothetical protein [Chelatococcus asaccharovorans]PXW54546.1 hypothetical protein C7450_11177 [Chelatococcus asaccharovorans]